MSTVLRRSGPHRPPRTPRGQTLVIAALIMLVVAVAVFLTFSIGHRTREKIKLQAVADASAYSLAVAEARTFNFYAFSNRAHVAHDVSILSIHSHQSYISWYEGLMKKVQEDFRATIPMWVGYCACYLNPYCPFPKCPKSCRNVGLASQLASLYEDERGGRQWIHERYHEGNLARYDKRLATASSVHLGIIGNIALQQEKMQRRLTDLMRNQTLATQLAKEIDPRITGLGSSDKVSLAYYENAVGIGGSKGEDWLEITHTTRYPGWITGRHFTPGLYWGTIYAKVIQKATPDLVALTASDDGTAKTMLLDPSSASAVRSALEKDDFGGAHAFGSADHGSVRLVWYSAPACVAGMSRSWTDAIYSEPDDGGHSKSFHTYEGGSSRTEPALEGDGHGLGGCDEDNNCGIRVRQARFKLHDGDKDRLWYQPRTVAAVTKQQNAGSAYPWDFDFKVDFPLAAQFSTRKSRGDSLGGPMAAIAGGLVYYHKPDGDQWKEPPSLWNPFWRAKLHPLLPSDAARALADHPSGDLSGDFETLYHY